MIGRDVLDQGLATLGCDFCRFAQKRPAQDNWVIWVQNCNELDTRTGLPTRFYVYVQQRPGRYGSHKEYNAAPCATHAWQAYTVMQETYAMEVAECEQTERWLSRRNSRI